MSFDAEKLKVGREPVTILELQLDYCNNAYGVAPCTASGPAGGECYNTYSSCQDIPNYSKVTKSYYFITQHKNTPKGLIAFPAITAEPRLAPTKIIPDRGLGWRGSVSVSLQDFPHHDRSIDPYVGTRTYVPIEQGTFFGKLRARNPYFKGRIMKVWTGYLTDPFDWANFESRTYVIDKIDGPNYKGQIKITGKDILTLADDKKAQVPVASYGTLAADIDSVSTAGLTLSSGSGPNYAVDPYTGAAISAAVPGYVSIGDEVIQYTGVSTDTLTGLSRAQWGTAPDTHSIDDAVQQCLYFNNANVVDIINHILKTYTNGITESYIPYDAGKAVPAGVDDEWDLEKASWLSSNNLTHILTKPVGVNECLVNLCTQNLLYIWWDDVFQKIKLKALSPNLKNEVPQSISENTDILADTISVEDNVDGRISELWAYYDKIDISGDNKPENYRFLKIVADSSETANAYDSKAVRVIYADWMRSANAALVLTLAGRLVARYKDTPRTIKFQMDAKNSDIRPGDHLKVNVSAIQSNTGAPATQKVQILKVTEKAPGHIFEFEAESVDYQLLRYGFVAPNGMVDYTSATDVQKQSYGFISGTGGNFADGGQPYLIS